MRARACAGVRACGREPLPDRGRAKKESGKVVPMEGWIDEDTCGGGVPPADNPELKQDRIDR